MTPSRCGRVPLWVSLPWSGLPASTVRGTAMRSYIPAWMRSTRRPCTRPPGTARRRPPFLPTEPRCGTADPGPCRFSPHRQTCRLQHSGAGTVAAIRLSQESETPFAPATCRGDSPGSVVAPCDARRAKPRQVQHPNPLRPRIGRRAWRGRAGRLHLGPGISNPGRVNIQAIEAPARPIIIRKKRTNLRRSQQNSGKANKVTDQASPQPFLFTILPFAGARTHHVAPALGESANPII